MADDEKLIERLAFDIAAARRDHIAAGEGTRHWPKPAARTVLRTLAAAGRLLPPGGEVSTQWGVRKDDPWGARVVAGPFTESAARDYAADQRRFDEGTSRRPAELASRTRVTWPDGTELIGPWAVVSDNSEVSNG